MVFNLYGHPNAQDHWWHHLHQVILSLGFESAGEAWTSVYFHKGHKTILIVYVDDLKLSGPTAVLPKVWEILRKHVWVRSKNTVVFLVFTLNVLILEMVASSLSMI